MSSELQARFTELHKALHRLNRVEITRGERLTFVNIALTAAHAIELRADELEAALAALPPTGWHQFVKACMDTSGGFSLRFHDGDVVKFWSRTLGWIDEVREGERTIFDSSREAHDAIPALPEPVLVARPAPQTAETPLNKTYIASFIARLRDFRGTLVEGAFSQNDVFRDHVQAWALELENRNLPAPPTTRRTGSTASTATR